MSSQIYLYSGEGSASLCAQALKNQLADLVDDREHQIREITSLADCWNDPQSVRAVCVPGGSAFYMGSINDLSSKASSIREIFEKYHISYYGACAGGMLGSSEFQLCRAEKDKVTVVSPEFIPALGLYPGRTLGPLFPKPCLEDFSSPANIQVGEVLIPSVQLASPAYVGVCDAEILGTYGKLPRVFTYVQELISPTSISESLFYCAGENKPRVLLTGSHPEFDSTAIRSQTFKEIYPITNEVQEEIAQTFEKSDAARKTLLKGYFEKIGITCKN